MALTPERIAELERLKAMMQPLATEAQRKAQAIFNAEKNSGQPVRLPTDKAKGGMVHMSQGGIDDDYRGSHTAPGPHFGAPMHNVAQGMYPEDFYGPMGQHYYANEGWDFDRDAYNKVMQVKNKPNEMVSVHRAVPTSVYKEALKKDAPLKHMIRKGDWVAIHKDYAKSHGESALNGDYKIASMRVPARHVWTNADSIHEWGYHPDEPVKTKAKGGTISQDAMRLALMNKAESVPANKRMIEDVYGQYPVHPFNPNQRAMVEGEGEDQTLGTFELKPSMSARNAVELDWLSAYPHKQGVGSRTLKKLQEHAIEHGVGLTLFPWEHGGVSQSKLIKFYKKHGFMPTTKGGKAMIWRPEEKSHGGATHAHHLEIEERPL